jgi:hypothetical protein
MMRSSYELFLRCIWEVETLTDPKDEHFKEASRNGEHYRPFGDQSFLGQPFGWNCTGDKRVLKISRHALFKRMVTFLQTADTPNSARVKRMLLKAIRECVRLDFRKFQETEEENAGDKEIHMAQTAFNDRQADVAGYGVVRVIVDLLCEAAVGTVDGTRTVLAVLRLANALLEGGNKRVQDAMHEYARNDSPSNFFEALHTWLKIAVRAKSETRSTNDYQPDDPVEEWKQSACPSKHDDYDDDESEHGEYMLYLPIVRFLQLWCENHNEGVQNALRVQHGYRRSGQMFDIVSQCVHSLGELGTSEQAVRLWTRAHVEQAIPLLQVLLECAQGPCQANQELLCNSVFLDVALAIISAEFKTHTDSEQLVEAIKKARPLIKKAHQSSRQVHDPVDMEGARADAERAERARAALVQGLHKLGLQEVSPVLELTDVEDLHKALQKPEAFVDMWPLRLADKVREIDKVLMDHDLRSLEERVLHVDDPSSLAENIVADLVQAGAPNRIVWDIPTVLGLLHSPAELQQAVVDPEGFASRRPERLTTDMAKQLKANAVKLLTCLLEGRDDFKLHDVLVERVEPSLLKMRIVALYNQFQQQQVAARHFTQARHWDEIFLDEACDLMTLVQRLNDFDVTFEQKMQDDTDPEYTR